MSRCMMNEKYRQIYQEKVFYLLNKIGIKAAKKDRSDTRKPVSIKDAIVECTRFKKGEIQFDTSQFSNLVFPSPHQMIFISHQSSDINHVWDIIGAIIDSCPYTECFIDSVYWENVYQAIEELQSRHARKDENTLLQSKCNDISKHMYLTLSTALIKAIKNSPMFVYIPPKDDVSMSGKKQMKTKSPWLALELLTSSLLEEPTKRIASYGKPEIINENLHFMYTLEIGHLHKVSVKDLVNEISHLN